MVPCNFQFAGLWLWESWSEQAKAHPREHGKTPNTGHKAHSKKHWPHRGNTENIRSNTDHIRGNTEDIRGNADLHSEIDDPNI